MLSKIFKWWRSRGHGIHSPFAYKMVTETLRCKEGYYIYERIDNIPVDEHERELLRLLARLIIRFRPNKVAIVGEWAGSHQIIRSLLSNVEIVNPDEHPDVIIIAEAHYLKTDITTPVVAMVLNINHSAHKLWTKLSRTHNFGMCFSNGETGVACLLPHLPRQNFNINF